MATQSPYDPTDPEALPFDPNDPTLQDPIYQRLPATRTPGGPTSSPYTLTPDLTQSPSDPTTEPVSTTPSINGGPLPTGTAPAGTTRASSGFYLPTTGSGAAQPNTNPTGPGYDTPGHTDTSFNAYASDGTVQTIQTALQQGMEGQNLVTFVQQHMPGAKVTWDAVRGNVDLDLGGGTGLQFDRNAAGVWGVHPYSDGAGGPGAAIGAAGVGIGANTGGADLQSLLTQLLAGNPQSGRDQQLWDQIQAMEASATQPVTANDPIIKAQTDAYNVQQQRGAQQGQAALAEQNAYRGIPTGTQDAGTAGLYENAATNTANFQAQNIAQELQSRRAQLTQALSLGAGVLGGDQTRQIQAEIAAIDAQIRNQGLVNQNNQFYDSLGLTAAEQEALLNAQLVSQMGG